MKVNYLPRNNRKSPYRRRILILIGVFVCAAIFFSLLGSSLVGLISPLWKAENGLLSSAGNSLGFLRSKASLVEENNELKDRISSLETELGSLRSKLITQDALDGLTINSEDGGAVAVAVLTRPPQTPYDILVIDAGAREAVRENMEVLLPEGPVIGRVTEVFEDSSRVKLFSAVNLETSAVLERHAVPVTLVGVGAGNFRIVVPRDVEVLLGDKILSPDMNSRLIGIVGEIEETPTESFKEILASSPTNIFHLRFVYLRP